MYIVYLPAKRVLFFARIFLTVKSYRHSDRNKKKRLTVKNK